MADAHSGSGCGNPWSWKLQRTPSALSKGSSTALQFLLSPLGGVHGSGTVISAHISAHHSFVWKTAANRTTAVISNVLSYTSAPPTAKRSRLADTKKRAAGAEATDWAVGDAHKVNAEKAEVAAAVDAKKATAGSALYCKPPLTVGQCPPPVESVAPARPYTPPTTTNRSTTKMRSPTAKAPSPPLLLQPSPF